MRSNDVYKRAFNDCLSHIEQLSVGEEIGAEASLARSLSVSRTTVRSVLETLEERRIIADDGRSRRIVRLPIPNDFFPEAETQSVHALIERRFMDFVLEENILPGQQVNALELSRRFSVSPSAIREYLRDFSECGLIERRPSGSWIFVGFDRDFAQELCDVRQIFELESARRFVNFADDDAVWGQLNAIERAHLWLLEDYDARHVEFPHVDNSLHSLINSASKNRFINRFDNLRCLIFHCHYSWNKVDEKERNFVAIHEHLRYIAALRSRDKRAIEDAAIFHLGTARQTLLASLDRRHSRHGEKVEHTPGLSVC
ncbi:GntR family transcriptional regulator [Consotaella salsifontis]|uniref:Transcriptional regulator, GntR family n=1 Tax=Consotaella salsifontis TaxID=1365950 RepID=A0A1T4LJ14_9HYPH|nr:GntR family transcriptional regulator [Consotaella salsifontis]SJZ54720.1 transcriptional regulator, GntR family [Consotaella salsifontis]